MDRERWRLFCVFIYIYSFIYLLFIIGPVVGYATILKRYSLQIVKHKLKSDGGKVWEALAISSSGQGRVMSPQMLNALSRLPPL